MSGWNPSAAPPHPYQPVSAPIPGPTPNYAPNYPPQGGFGQPQGGYGYGGDQKDPYAGERFKPKKRINDPIFLALFIAQVSRCSCSGCVAHADIRAACVQFIGFIIVSIITISKFGDAGGLGGGVGKGATGGSITLN